MYLCRVVPWCLHWQCSLCLCWRSVGLRAQFVVPSALALSAAVFPVLVGWWCLCLRELSLWDYTHVVMNCLAGNDGLTPETARTYDWLKLFDVVITGR